MKPSLELFDSPLITLSLGEFAMPVPRRGHLENLAGSGAASEGLEIHQRVQRRRAKADPGYRCEVAVSREFTAQQYRFLVKGRLDGIFPGNPPHIEEIKTTFNIHELARRLNADPEHPYCLQLKSYGYFHWLEHGVIPELSFHLVSTRNGKSQEVRVELDLAAYEHWLERRLESLVLEAVQAERCLARRRKLAATLVFPFAAARPGQRELIDCVEQGLAQKMPQLLQAPTGLGKTVGVLYLVLKEALGRGQQAIYVTPKNSQHGVAEDAVERFRGAGAALKSLTITAKHKICFKDEPLCHPELCEFARDYYEKLERAGLVAILARKKKLKSRHFRALGEEHQVCPFELQLAALPEADLVICDYNYVFAPRSALGRVTALNVGQRGKPSLIIDEAHNLPSRAMDYYSPQLSAQLLESWREGLGALPRPFGNRGVELLEGCLETIAQCRAGEGSRARAIQPPVRAFADQEARIAQVLSRYLESTLEIGQGDPLLALARSWSEFTGTLELVRDAANQEFSTTFHPGAGGILKITCCDAGELLAGCYAGFEQVIGFSATLKPFDYYARLSGLDPGKVLTEEFQSPFPPERRKLLIIPQVSTRYSERERNYGKITDALERMVALKRGNYFAFFPSFSFLERVAQLFRAPQGFQVRSQERKMSAARVEALLEELRDPGAATVVFAVQGGSFSEGIDYQGDMAIGAFVVGPPLPNYDLERELMREYYQRRFGLGFEYAYAIPAMAKAVQAAGRVIRSETDRGIIVLMDGRFLEPGFSSAMPVDWYEDQASELVSAGILKDIADFWDGCAETGVVPAGPELSAVSEGTPP
ncbi:ATP-dependent helicase [Geomonas limicola]|uniref:ATP-dependent helicase n=1 Tax=Geomonas limicola TaxID=2740186 RepID=A0A6V8N4U0_9BACT|nr:ATP-dependent DNA helicase [Geomonas limicola]GFO67582.1 ATP-dependent helicase [Geomonas limicola]